MSKIRDLLNKNFGMSEIRDFLNTIYMSQGNLFPKGEFLKELYEGSLWFECLSFTLSYLQFGSGLPLGTCTTY